MARVTEPDKTKMHARPYPSAEAAAPRELMRPSGVRTILALLTDWGIVCVVAVVCENLRSGWIYALGLFMIARQMNALFELHHHAIHGNLFPARVWNQRLDWLYSIPLLARVCEDRDEHLEHHRTYSVEAGDSCRWGTGYGLDPSRRDRPGYMLWFLLVRPFTGVLQLDALRSAVRNPGWKKAPFRRALAGYWLTVTAVLAIAGRPDWILWYWVIPYFTVYQVLFFWDDMIGHYNCPRTGTREMRGVWFRLMAAHGTAYHNVHHRYPKIPWFRQERATALMVDETSVDVAHGFSDAIRQMVIARD